MLVPREPQAGGLYPYRLSSTAYLIQKQLPSKSTGRTLHPQPEDAPFRGLQINSILILLKCHA